jgi:hydroxymethylpyrimidine kinase/phosphomethylpyrimidine kinase/thiamine-phosphate diphosphorylase
MNEDQMIICTLEEARARAGSAGDAPRLAQQLRAQGTRGVCIVAARDGMDWLETEHARGWLVGPAMAIESLRTSVQAACEAGFVDADAVVLAKTSPLPLPLPLAGEGGGEGGGAPRPSPQPSPARREREPQLPLLSWGEQPPEPPATASARRRLDVYAIVDSAARLRQVLDAGVRTVQLRIKTPAAPDAAWHALLREEVRQAVADSAAAGAELFVNDHWQLAHELGGRGVHLGQEDLLALDDAGRARLRATGMALGISSHSLWELARARTLSPRYIACGPVWPTLTKDMPWRPQGLDNLAWWCRAAGVPVTAIGGILDPAQAEQAARTGADGVCIVRGLGDDPRRTVPVFEAALHSGRAQPLEDLPGSPHPSLARVS